MSALNKLNYLSIKMLRVLRFRLGASQAARLLSTSSRASGSSSRESGGSVPRISLLLGASGFIPFAFYAAQHEPLSAPAPPRGDRLLSRIEAQVLAPGLLSAFAAGDQAGVRRLFNSYGAVILSFMGAVHWGRAMGPCGLPSQYAVSVLPSLLGWVALNAREDRVAPLLLAGGFFFVYFYDELMIRRSVLPAWYSTLRTPLTVGVVSSCLAAAHLSKPLPE